MNPRNNSQLLKMAKKKIKLLNNIKKNFHYSNKVKNTSEYMKMQWLLRRVAKNKPFYRWKNCYKGTPSFTTNIKRKKL